jgi:hypothetical protein
VTDEVDDLVALFVLGDVELIPESGERVFGILGLGE